MRWRLSRTREERRGARVVWYTRSQALLAVAVLSSCEDRPLWGLSEEALSLSECTLHSKERRKKEKRKALESPSMDSVSLLVCWWVSPNFPHVHPKPATPNPNPNHISILPAVNVTFYSFFFTYLLLKYILHVHNRWNLFGDEWVVLLITSSHRTVLSLICWF